MAALRLCTTFPSTFPGCCSDYHYLPCLPLPNTHDRRPMHLIVTLQMGVLKPMYHSPKHIFEVLESVTTITYLAFPVKHSRSTTNAHRHHLLDGCAEADVPLSQAHFRGVRIGVWPAPHAAPRHAALQWIRSPTGKSRVCLFLSAFLCFDWTHTHSHSHASLSHTTV
jgi:hypothetical protein